MREARSRPKTSPQILIKFFNGYIDVLNIKMDVYKMITPAQLRAARALLGWDQKKLADFSGISLATIQRMELSEGNVRGNIDSLTRIVSALEAAGIELISDDMRSRGRGRGVRQIDCAVSNAPDATAKDGYAEMSPAKRIK